MAALFNKDFVDFLEALDKHQVNFLLVGGYAVILHGYVRSTADMDIWVEKTDDNYSKLKNAFTYFGAPIFPKDEFFSRDFDVWSIGREPNKIDIISEIKGLNFFESKELCEWHPINNFKIPYIHFNHLLNAKKAAGRFKDLADIEELEKKNNPNLKGFQNF